MTPTNDFDRLFESWLRNAGPADIDPVAVGAALDAARRTSQRRGLLAWAAGPGAWPQTRRFIPVVSDLPPGVRLTLVAGLLLVALAALSLAGAGSAPAPSPRPVPTQPGVVVAPSPSATPLLGTLPCQSAAGFIGDMAASTGPVPSSPASGGAATLLVRLATTNGRYELAEFDPTQADAVPQRLMGIGGLESEIVPSPDGRAIAIGANPGLVFPCVEPVVVSRAGDWYTVPFHVNRVGLVQHLAWSRDGGMLYGIHTSNTDGSSTILPTDPGSVWAWDARADTVKQLGSPCKGCALGDPTVGPDGMLAVAFTMCAATPADHVQLECMSGGVALLEPGGWRTVTTTAQLLTTAPDSFALTLLGWSDASTLVIGSVSTGVTRLGLDGTLTHVGGGGGGNGGELLVLSPDGVTTALNTVEIDYVNNETHPEIVLTPVAGGPLRIIGKSAPAGDFGQPRWSPEGTSIAAVWTTASGVSLVASGIAIVDVATGTSRQIAVPVAWMGTDSPTPVAWLPPVR